MSALMSFYKVRAGLYESVGGGQFRIEHNPRKGAKAAEKWVLRRWVDLGELGSDWATLGEFPSAQGAHQEWLRLMRGLA